jgi:hypothetical protein
MNLNVFPKSYYKNTYPSLKSLQFIGEVKKGIMSGQNDIVVDGRKVCTTTCHDLIEQISYGHPVG